MDQHAAGHLPGTVCTRRLDHGRTRAHTACGRARDGRRRTESCSASEGTRTRRAAPAVAWTSRRSENYSRAAVSRKELHRRTRGSKGFAAGLHGNGNGAHCISFAIRGRRTPTTRPKNGSTSWPAKARCASARPSRAPGRDVQPGAAHDVPRADSPGAQSTHRDLGVVRPGV